MGWLRRIERQKTNLKANEFNAENNFILIDSEADEQRNIDEKGKRFGKVMCMKGDKKREKSKMICRMGR